MRYVSRNFILLTVAVASAWCQPIINGVTHAATFRANQFPFAGLPQGGLAVIVGSALGPSNLVQASSYPLQKTLAGSSVSIASGSATFGCLMVYTLDRQIAFILPSAVPRGSAQVRVTYNGQTSAPASVTIVDRNPGVYTWPQDGGGPGIATDAINGALITVLAPAKPGQLLTIWASGLGAVTGDEAQPPVPTDLGGDLNALIGAQPADIIYRGRASCCTGLDQINLRVPPNAPSGCYVPMYFKSASSSSISNVTTIPITADGSPCGNPLGFAGLNLAGKDHVVTGQMLLERNFNRNANGSVDTADFLHMTYNRADQQFFNSASSIDHEDAIAPGTCVVNQQDNTSQYDPLHATLLDAGPAITLTLGGRTFRFPRDDFGGYGAFIQGASPLDVSGAGSLSNGAGAQVPAFNLSFTTPALANFQWNEQASLADLSAGQPLTVSWSGADPDGFVYIVAQTNNQTLNMTFTCRVAGSQTQFTVPGDITAFLPPGNGSLTLRYHRPVSVSGLPTGFDALRYERLVVRSRSIAIH